MTLIVASFVVWIFHELPNLNSAVSHASFTCTVNNAWVPADWTCDDRGLAVCAVVV
ncbi:MAG TPA: hypothetical protein VHJ79_09075 [Mycobacterium sp.]|nr:hypothetical protein [Mycobacterium sp.]